LYKTYDIGIFEMFAEEIMRVKKCYLVSILLATSLVFAASCKKKTKGDGKDVESTSKTTKALFTHLSPEESGLDFVNKVNEKDSINVLNFLNYYNGTGVAVGDIDNDGLLDVFLTANTSGCKLFRNKGNFKFEDITDKAGISTPGWCTGAVMGDINNDGFMDIYLCRSGVWSDSKTNNLLFINNQNGTFSEKAAEYGVDDANLSNASSLFDMDNDGDLDLYVLNFPNRFDLYLDNQMIDNTRAEESSTHRMYENLGNGKFKEITKPSGMFSFGFGLSATPGDFNRDGLMDLYVCNDFMTPDFLYINNGDNTFSNKHQQYFKHTTFSSMGSDVADYNNDGLIDLMIVDMLPEDNYSRKMIAGSVNWDIFQMAARMGYGQQFMRNTLHLNNGEGYFSEISGLAGVVATDWSWTPLFVDIDNDGNKDMFISNGAYRDVTNNDFMNYQYDELRNKDKKNFDRRKLLDALPSKKIMSYVYKNNGDLTFSNKTAEWGITQKKYASTGAAYADLDNDGDMDLISANINDNVLVYKNNASEILKHNYLKIKLKGTESNVFGYGSKVTVTAGDKEQYFECTGIRGFQSSSDPYLNVGLGKATTIEKVTVIWPSGKMQTLQNVKPNQTLTLNEGDADGKFSPEEDKADKPFVEITKAANLKFFHFEDKFVDFKRDRLVPHMLSRLGPGIAVGDVNNDGKDDFFIGNGAESQGGTLFVQDNTGSIRVAAKQPWRNNNAADNMGCLFFDLENDGDLDLYIANGGSHDNFYPNTYQHHLYINDGKGNFKQSAEKMPLNMSASVVSGADYDGDGDIDLFVGGRSLPGKYPKSSPSAILINDNGKLINATEQILPELKTAGMVCAAIWTDCNGDNKVDLIVTGEFMEVKVFINQNGKLVNKTREFGLGQSTGWWNSISAGDFDNDGDMDYIVGNRGMNGYFKATPSEPVRVYAKDFDNNGSLDPILTYYIMGQEYMHAELKDLASQMPTIQRNYSKYHQYAIQKPDEVFNKEDLLNSIRLEAKYFASVMLVNNNNTGFTIKELPQRAQFGPVYGTNVIDYDNDGNLDVILSGNSLSVQIEMGYEDALNGLVLKGDGKGNFTPQITSETGYYTPYDAKSLARLSGEGYELFLVGNNSSYMQSIRLQTQSKTVKLAKDEYKLIVTLDNGKKHVVENAYGAGYLTQNSRVVRLTAKAKSVEVFNFNGKSRKVSF
jgi:hypothetical protein